MEFGRLTELVRNRIKLQESAVMRFLFKEHELDQLVIDLNKLHQLFDNGIDSQGNIAGEYSEYTEAINQGRSFKGREKIAGRPYFFYDEGDFFNSFYVKILDDGIEIGATDLEKLSDVIDEPESLIGLTDESKEILIGELLPQLRKRILGLMLE